MRLLILLVAALTACAPLGAPVSASPTIVPSPTASAAASTPSRSAASTTVASPTAFPDVAMPTIAFGQRAVYALGPSGAGVKVFECRDSYFPNGASVTFAERSPDGKRLLVICFYGADGEGFVLEAGGAPQEIPAGLDTRSGAWSPDSMSVALVGLECAYPCSQLLRYDIASRKLSILREEDARMENLRWTTCGLTYFRERPPGGTFLLEGSSWRRIGSDRIAASGVNGLC